jgi:hypothetical protein
MAKAAGEALDWSLDGGEARYALSWCSWRFLWARLLHSKFRSVFGSMSLRMIVLFIVHSLKKLVLASRTFRCRTGKNILKDDTETYSFDFLTWQYGLAFEHMFAIGIPFPK